MSTKVLTLVGCAAVAASAALPAQAAACDNLRVYGNNNNVICQSVTVERKDAEYYREYEPVRRPWITIRPFIVMAPRAYYGGYSYYGPVPRYYGYRRY